MRKIEIESRIERLDVEHEKIIAFARTFMIFLDEPDSLEEPFSIEMLSYFIDKWELCNSMPPVNLGRKKRRSSTIYGQRKERPPMLSRKMSNERIMVLKTMGTEKYSCLKDMIKKYKQEESEIIKLEKKVDFGMPQVIQDELRPYIEALFFAGKIQADRKRIVKSLRDVACFLGGSGILLSYNLLKKSFLNRDGTALTKSNIKQAMAEGNKVYRKTREKNITDSIEVKRPPLIKRPNL